MLEYFFERLINEIKATNQNYKLIIEKKGAYKPIPFFGNIESAKVLTVGVNPSRTEFDDNRNWPREDMHAKDLKNRLVKYFNPEESFCREHGWFEEWERVLNLINFSYFNGTAPLGRGHAQRQVLGPLPVLQVAAQTAFHFCRGAKHGVLVVDDRLLEMGVLHADVVRDPSVVQDRPADVKSDEAVETV